MDDKIVADGGASALALCLADVASSNNVLRKNALKKLESLLVSKLSAQSALCLLRGKVGENLPPLSEQLLAIIGDDTTSEICREKAALNLCTLMRAVFENVEPSERGTEGDVFLFTFFVTFALSFHSRLFPCITGEKTTPGRVIPREESEEIRLLLVNVVSSMLTYMAAGLCKNTGKHDDDNTNEDNDCVLVHQTHITNAASLVCEAIAKSALDDPYPELKREACVIITKMVHLFPSVVRTHGEALLRSLTGGSSTFGNVAPIGGIKNIAKSLQNNAAMASSSVKCLLRHRHAKTRCLAVEVSADILSCYSRLPLRTDVNAEFSSEYLGSGVFDGKKSKGDGLQDVLATHILPNWEAFPPYDRSISVRVALTKAAGKILKTVTIESDSLCEVGILGAPVSVAKKAELLIMARLLVLVYMGLSDEADTNKVAAAVELSEFSAILTKRLDIHSTAELPSRRSFISTLSSDVIERLIAGASPMLSLEQRVRALNTLCVAIKAFPSAIRRVHKHHLGKFWCSNLVNNVVAILCDSLVDDEKAVFDAGLSSARALGEDSESGRLALQVILLALTRGQCEEEISDFLRFETTENKTNETVVMFSTPQRYASALSFLSGLVSGASQHNICNVWSIEKLDQAMTASSWLCPQDAAQISHSFVTKAMMENVNASQAAAWGLLDACQSLVVAVSTSWPFEENQNVIIERNTDKDRSGLNAMIVNLVYCGIQLLGCQVSFELRDSVLELLDLISKIHPTAQCTESLVEACFQSTFHLIIRDIGADLWQIDDPGFRAFEALLRLSGGQSIEQNFSLIAPVLERHLVEQDSNEQHQCERNRDLEVALYRMKLTVMALLEAIVSNNELQRETMRPFSANLLTVALLPNLVWKVGGMASALRKVTAATVFSLLRGGGLTADCVLTLAPQLFPVLKTNLEDDDETTRELIVSSLSTVFEIISGMMGEEWVHQLYPGIVKCLDDSSESVRFSAIHAFRHFLRAAPVASFRGTAIEYMVEQLMVHLDDPDPQFQSACLEVLTVALEIDLGAVVKQTRASKASHRSGYACDILLQRVAKMTELKTTTDSVKDACHASHSQHLFA